MTGASFAATPTLRVVGRPRGDRHADAAEERSVSDRNDDGCRRLLELVEELVGDRAVALVLRRLGAVLEEGKPRLPGMAARLALGLVEVGPDEPYLGPEPLDERNLRLGRPLRRVDDGIEAHPLGCPGSRGSVVSRGGGDDGVGTGLAVGAQHRERTAPLEGPELVDVLPLEEDLAIAGERARGGLERGRRHAAQPTL